MKKKRILHLLASNSFSGAENVVCTIIDNCSDKYDMYYCSPDGPIKKSLEERNIKFIPLKKMSIFELKKIVKKYNVDIIHAHDYKASFFASVSGFKGKIISQLHLNWSFSSSWNLYTIAYSLVIRRFYKILVVSKAIMNEAVFTKRNNKKFEILLNVIDREKVLLKGNEFDVSSYDLVFVGRFTEIKRPEIFIDIIYELSKSNPKIKACMVGNGVLFDKCVDKINKYGLNKNIDMIGFVDNPFPYMKNSKILVMPSTHEGFGLVAIEAMILGTIVVNSGAGGLMSIFRDYPDYVCNDINDYIGCINELLKLDKITYKKDCDKMIKKFIDIKNYKNNLMKIYDGQ